MNETLSQVSNAITSYMDANWDTSVANVTWENGPMPLSGDGPWVRFSVRFYQPQFNTIGATCVHRRGFIAAQVFSRYDVGTGDVVSVADSVLALFELKRIDNIQFYEATTEHIGDSNRQLNHIESTWFQLAVNIPFETL